MKNEEDEAFDELARKQGMWGGGFPAKRAMAADKYSDIVSDGGLDPRNQFDAQPVHCQCHACKNGVLHWSDCAVHNGPAYPAGECDCGAAQKTEREALKLALEALEEYADYEGKTRAADEAITAIQAALAQPAQEPVGTLNISRYKGHLVNHDFDYFGELPDGTYSVYTAPPQREWVGLTDAEVMEMMGYDKQYGHIPQYARNFVEAISAKLKEKNDG